MPGMTIDNFDSKIYLDYIHQLETINTITPLYKSEETVVYLPAKAIVHTCAPWALFLPPKNFPQQLGPLFSPYQLIPTFSYINTSPIEEKNIDEIECNTEEEKAEKEVIKRCISKIKELKALLFSIGQQSGQLAYGPLEIIETIAKEEAKRMPYKETQQTAYTYVRQGKYRSAIPYLESLIESPHATPKDYETLGTVYLHTYRLEQAVFMLKKAYGLHPENGLIGLNLCKALCELKQYEEGLSIAKKLVHDTDPFIAENGKILLMQYGNSKKE